MRIWHEELVPNLCRQHLLGVWREGLGCFSILSKDKKGYRNHPAVKEFENHTLELWYRLEAIRNEMLSRGYHPKPLPDFNGVGSVGELKPWQSLEEQKEVLKGKNCECKL